MADKIKIAILGDATSINVQRWQQGLSQAGATVELLSIHITHSDDVHTHTIPVLRLHPAKLRYFAAIPAARRLLNRLKPDLVIGYFVTGYGTLSAFSGYRPLVQVTSGEDILTSPANPLFRALIRFNLSRADLVVAWAPHMAAAAQSIGVPEAKLFTLPRGIPLQGYQECCAPVPEDHRPIRLICTRSFYPIYNIDVLIKTVKVLRDRQIDCTLTLAGSGPLQSKLMALTHELGIEQAVSFCGVIPNDDLPRILASHDIYIALPQLDGVSASLLEAMSAGIFPIVFDHSANRYWIETGRNGILTNTLIPDAVADDVTRAYGDVKMRRYAQKYNRTLVFERGDLYRNTAIYLERFRQVVREHKQ